MADPLLALRQNIEENREIILTNIGGIPCVSLVEATHIRLSDSLSFPKSAPTRLRAVSATDFVTLDAVYLAWIHRDASGADYMRQARENGLLGRFISVTERKGLVDWLQGRSTHHDRIVPLPDSLPPSDSPSKRKYVPDPADAELVKKINQNEIELSDRISVLRGPKPNNFNAIRLVYAEKLKRLKDAAKSGSAPLPAPTPKLDPKIQARKARNLFPIIIISSSPTSLITMHNVKRFLQDASFEPPNDARARAAAEGNPRPEDLIPLYRKRTHIDPSGQDRESQARYCVVDGVEALAKFGNDAWDRVIAVLTTGQAWQFKPYKWTEPRTLFHHVKGFYVSWANDPPNPKIKDWNVTELKIDPHRRHVDKSVVASFWKTLDSWTLANKPWLMKS